MSSLENELNPHEFYKIYIHQYKDVRYLHWHTFVIADLRFMTFMIVDLLITTHNITMFKYELKQVRI